MNVVNDVGRNYCISTIYEKTEERSSEGSFKIVEILVIFKNEYQKA